MNAAVTPAAQQPAGTLDSMKHVALQTVNWMGRQVQALASSVKDIVMRIVNFMKPFFQNLAKVAGEFVSKAIDFAKANKEITVIGFAATCAIAAATLAAFFHYSGESQAETATA